MCTYHTETLSLDGSMKAPGGTWVRLEQANVYFDHPVHAPTDHTVNVDLRSPALGAAARVALELPAEDARRLARAILATVDGAAPLLSAD